MHIKGVVISDYTPASKSKGSATFLVVSKEEIVLVKEQHNSGWYFCENFDSSEKGWVPKEHITLSIPLKAISDFFSASEDELSMRKGEVLFGLNVENDWWYGLKNDLGGIGWFPCSYVLAASDVVRISTNTGTPPAIILSQPDTASTTAPISQGQGLKKRKSLRESFNFSNPLEARFKSNRASQRLDPNDIKLNVQTGPTLPKIIEKGNGDNAYDKEKGKLTTTVLSTINVLCCTSTLAS